MNEVTVFNGEQVALHDADDHWEVTPMPEPRNVKQLIGHDVAVDCHDGRRTHGRLLNANARSLWLVTADEDRFIPLSAVARLDRAS